MLRTSAFLVVLAVCVSCGEEKTSTSQPIQNSVATEADEAILSAEHLDGSEASQDLFGRYRAGCCVGGGVAYRPVINRGRIFGPVVWRRR